MPEAFLKWVRASAFVMLSRLNIATGLCQSHYACGSLSSINMNLAERLAHAMAEGPRAPMNANQLATKTKLNRTAIGFVLSGKTRQLKSGNATKIAAALGISVAWLVDEEGPMVELTQGSYAMSGSIAPYGGGSRSGTSKGPNGKILSIPQLDVFASMGTGVDLQEHVEVVRMIQVNLTDLRRILPSFSAPENLVIITGLGDSMRGTFNDGDPIIVDQGVTDVTVEGIYVLRRDDELFIKRLQRQLDGTLMMISDNPRYPPQHITDDARKTFDVVGRALGVWNFQKF